MSEEKEKINNNTLHDQSVNYLKVLPRIALCISGQPRGYKIAFDYVKKNLLDHYEMNPIDVFIHTWEGSNTKKAIKLYIPTKERTYEYVGIENNDDVIHDYYSNKYQKIASEKHPARNTLRMLYTVYMANWLKKKYEMKMGFKYDYVIKTRFDYALNIKLDMVNLQTLVEPGKVYVPNCRTNPSHTFCNDQFAFGTSEAIDWYSNAFVNIDRLYSAGFPLNGEEMLSGNLQINGLVGENMVYVDMKNPFPPGPYNSTTHSLVRDDFKEWNSVRG